MVQKRNFASLLEAHALSFDAQKTRFRALEEWLKTPQGLDISDFFKLELSHLDGLLYGETLLQLGVSGKNIWLEALHYTHKWLVNYSSGPSATFLSAYNQLPIDRNSLDCIVAPLVMEAFEQSNSPIDEIDRILKPMGYVIFFGINPFSLWGLNIRINRSSCFGVLKAMPKSVFSLQRAMIHRGYSQSYFSTFYYIPPVASRKWLDKLEIFNELGKMMSPCPSGFYCLVMQKLREAPPNLLLNETGELWRQRRFLQPSCQLKTPE